MAKIEQRLAALGLPLHQAVQAPAGVVLPFQFVRVIGTRAFISGHAPTLADGSIAGPLGKLGRERHWFGIAAVQTRPRFFQFVA